MTSRSNTLHDHHHTPKVTVVFLAMIYHKSQLLSPCKSDITLPFCISFCLFAKTPQMAAGFLVSDEIYYVFVQKHRKYKSGFQKEPVDKKAQTCWSQQKKFSNSVITRVLSRKAAQTHKPCWFPSLPARNRNKIVLWSVEEVVFLLRLLKGSGASSPCVNDSHRCRWRRYHEFCFLLTCLPWLIDIWGHRWK